MKRADDTTVITMTQQGRSRAEIAEALDIHPDSVTRVRKRNGLTTPPHRLTDDEVETAAALIAGGASIAEAARTIGRGADGLYSRFSQRWTRSQSGRQAAMLRKFKEVL